MGKVIIEIETGNAAFEDFPGQEVERILSQAAHRLFDGLENFKLYDINGNQVGSVAIVEDEDDAEDEEE